MGLQGSLFNRFPLSIHHGTTQIFLNHSRFDAINEIQESMWYRINIVGVDQTLKPIKVFKCLLPQIFVTFPGPEIIACICSPLRINKTKDQLWSLNAMCAAQPVGVGMKFSVWNKKSTYSKILRQLYKETKSNRQMICAYHQKIWNPHLRHCQLWKVWLFYYTFYSRILLHDVNSKEQKESLLGPLMCQKAPKITYGKSHKWKLWKRHAPLCLCVCVCGGALVPLFLP